MFLGADEGSTELSVVALTRMAMGSMRLDDSFPLPDELLIHVFSFLAPRDLVAASQVAKQWRRSADSDVLWERVCVQGWRVWHRYPSLVGTASRDRSAEAIQGGNQAAEGAPRQSRSPESRGSRMPEAVRERWPLVSLRAAVGAGGASTSARAAQPQRSSVASPETEGSGLPAEQSAAERSPGGADDAAASSGTTQASGDSRMEEGPWIPGMPQPRWEAHAEERAPAAAEAPATEAQPAGGEPRRAAFEDEMRAWAEDVGDEEEWADGEAAGLQMFHRWAARVGWKRVYRFRLFLERVTREAVGDMAWPLRRSACMRRVLAAGNLVVEELERLAESGDALSEGTRFFAREAMQRLHTRTCVLDMRRLLGAPEPLLSEQVARGALIIAKLRYRDLDTRAVERRLAHTAAVLRRRLDADPEVQAAGGPATPAGAVAAVRRLNQLLFGMPLRTQQQQQAQAQQQQQQPPLQRHEREQPQSSDERRQQAQPQHGQPQPPLHPPPARAPSSAQGTEDGAAGSQRTEGAEAESARESQGSAAVRPGDSPHATSRDRGEGAEEGGAQAGGAVEAGASAAQPSQQLRPQPEGQGEGSGAPGARAEAGLLEGGQRGNEGGVLQAGAEAEEQERTARERATAAAAAAATGAAAAAGARRVPPAADAAAARQGAAAPPAEAGRRGEAAQEAEEGDDPECLYLDGNREEYFNPRNSYINDVLDSRRGIPISLAVIHACVGRAAGIPVLMVGVPMHFLTKVGAEDSPHELFVDGFNRRTLRRSDCIDMIRSMHLEYQPRLLAPVPVPSVLLRMCNNLLYTQSETDQDMRPQSRDVQRRLLPLLDLLLEISPSDVPERFNKAKLLLAACDFEAVREEMRVLLRQTEAGGLPVAHNHALLQQFAENAEQMRQQHELWCSERYAPRPPSVEFRVGAIVRHRRYGYRAVVFGWDPQCTADESWISHMQVDRLRAGRQQPFYRLLVDIRDRRSQSTYVAQENLVPSPEMAPIQNTELGEYFMGLRGGRYVPNEYLRFRYPEDYADPPSMR